MKTYSLLLSIPVSALIFVFAAIPLPGQTSSPVRHIYGIRPVLGRGQVLSAIRSAAESHATPAEKPVSPTGNPWKLQASLSGAVIHDLSFPTATVGYAAAELGQVWKTTNGGSQWTEIMNLGFPYYWYGVHALTATDVVISGFNDKTFQGIIRWSHDGGKTWTKDIILTTTGWSDRVRFANKKDGLVVDQLSTAKGAPNAAHYTKDGGARAKDWTAVVPDPNGGWFGNQFSLLANLHARMSGITYCASQNDGATWSCEPSIDSVFDGPTFFANDKAGWVGGGEISPNVEGWVHRTTDGGKTWSGRTLDDTWPIREILFLSANKGWATGGNYSQNIGGMYFSRDGGQTWSFDANTGAEMDACDSRVVGKKVHVWCAGYNSSFTGLVYTLRTLAD